MSDTTLAERKGSLMKFKTPCGHWTVCYSLEPTPEACPDCLDKGRDSLKYWERDLSQAESHAEDCMNDDVAAWLAEDGTVLPEGVVTELQQIADTCREAWELLDDAYMRMQRLRRDQLPPAERLTMPSVSA